MKLKLLSLLFLMTLVSASAFCFEPGKTSKAEADTNAPDHRVFLGLATGFRNSTGLFGVTCEVYLYKGLNAIAGIGIGTWGYKPMVGLRYYFDYPYRYAIGMSYSYATGGGNTPISLELDVIDTAGATVRKSVPVKLSGVSVVNFSIMKFWRLGKHHRFNVEVGYSAPFQEGYAFKILSDDRVTQQSLQVLQILQPGGFMIGASFSFRL